MRKTILVSTIFIFLVSCSLFQPIQDIDGTAWREVRSLQEYYITYDTGQEKYFVLYRDNGEMIKVEGKRNKKQFSFVRELNGKQVKFSGKLYSGIYAGVKKDYDRSLLQILAFAKIAVYEITGITDFFIMFRLKNVKPEDFPQEVKRGIRGE